MRKYSYFITAMLSRHPYWSGRQMDGDGVVTSISGTNHVAVRDLLQAGLNQGNPAPV